MNISRYMSIAIGSCVVAIALAPTQEAQAGIQLQYTCNPTQCDSICDKVTTPGGNEICVQPKIPEFTSESDPGYDGCSVPEAAVIAGLFIEPHTATLVGIYTDEFAVSSDLMSSPCFVHDLAYNHYGFMYGFSKDQADDLLRDVALDYCRSKSASGTLAGSLSCAYTAGVFRLALRTQSAQDAWDDTLEACWDMHNIGIQPTTSDACACAYGDLTRCPPSPNIPQCGGGVDGQDPGCECKDVAVSGIENLLLEAPDGAGSFLETSNDRGQFCETPNVVCGAAEISAGVFDAMCMECGVDTNLGCACTKDSDCDGIEINLQCWGEDSDGWNNAGVGTCLRNPAVGNPEDLTFDDYAWLCPDRCDSVSTNGTGSAACAFGEFPGGVTFDVGTCVDTLQTCTGDLGSCEESGRICSNGSCIFECEATDPVADQIADCSGLGFDDTYVCGATNRCVPPECSGSGGVPDWCDAFLNG